jgi:superfamily II DNA/RNA helicase
VDAADDPLTEAAALSSLGLTPALIARAGEAGWVQATPIQAEAIPAILQGSDVLGLAPTGSGKTAAFLLPVLHRLLAVAGVHDERPRRLRALVLAPTRELAQQIEAAASALAPTLKTVLAVGGVSINPQMMALRGGAHLVVATPGRLLDLLGQRALLLGGVQTLTGPVLGAAVFTWLQDEIARNTEYWRAILGLAILALVLAFPHGLGGALKRLRGAA